VVTPLDNDYMIVRDDDECIMVLMTAKVGQIIEIRREPHDV